MRNFFAIVFVTLAVTAMQVGDPHGFDEIRHGAPVGGVGFGGALVGI